MNHPLFEIVTTSAGAISIRNKVVGEIMHNPVGPWAEANALYIEQSRLKERLQALSPGEELVVFDVGLGAAANALAALHCARAAGNFPGRFRLVSFEKDLELLRFALAHADQFEHFRGYEKILETLLAKHSWSEGALSWDLREGDFLDLVPQEIYRPHLIFFDPYSPQMNREMWTTHSFRQLRARSRDEEHGGTLLLTYSRATPIRAALLAAGFYIGAGPATGLKDETTQASTVLKHLPLPLEKKWLERFKRSHTKFPFDCEPSQEGDFVMTILQHPQFS